RMPAYHVERSIRVGAAESTVRSIIQDFNQWPDWSPWLCMEPTAQITVFGTLGEVGHGYEWEGDLVGAGKMRIASQDAQRLAMDLFFLRPFKSEAKVGMQTRRLSEQETEVTWGMDGKLPFFMFFLVGMMKTMIGRDFERGLKMLKEYTETGGVRSKIEIVGVVDGPEFDYVGVGDRCTCDEISASMQRTLPAAMDQAKANQLKVTGPPGAIYHESNLRQQYFRYTAFVPVAKASNAGGMQTGHCGPCRAIKVIHTGSYSHLGNAWSAAMSYQRYKKLKLSKSTAPFELYVNDPCETPEEQIVTEIYVPVRA
ncbi:MAG: GyrI-like domain-containing protein, partial [Planctomycetales bacterium]|nr:GyrI-like domain-containing protein [Planctomycetales bacterium]